MDEIKKYKVLIKIGINCPEYETCIYSGMYGCAVCADAFLRSKPIKILTTPTFFKENKK